MRYGIVTGSFRRRAEQRMRGEQRIEGGRKERGEGRGECSVESHLVGESGALDGLDPLRVSGGVLPDHDTSVCRIGLAI